LTDNLNILLGNGERIRFFLIKLDVSILALYWFLLMFREKYLKIATIFPEMKDLNTDINLD